MTITAHRPWHLTPVSDDTATKKRGQTVQCKRCGVPRQLNYSNPSEICRDCKSVLPREIYLTRWAA